jgi:hypothetical protein
MTASPGVLEGFRFAKVLPVPGGARPLSLDDLTVTIEGHVDAGQIQLVLFGREIASPCRRGPVWCNWLVSGKIAVCTIGGEVGTVMEDGEIAKVTR